MIDSIRLTISGNCRRIEAAPAVTRISSIIPGDEGKANPKLAEHLAVKTALAAAAPGRPKSSPRPASSSSERISYLKHRFMHNGLVITTRH